MEKKRTPYVGSRLFNLSLSAFIFFLLLSITSSWAQESRLHQVIQKKEIRVGTSGDYPPFSYLNPQTNQYEGMDIALAHKLGEALEAKVIFVRFKWPELTADLMADKFDIAMCHGRHWPQCSSWKNSRLF